MAGQFLVIATAAFASPEQLQAAGPLLSSLTYSLTAIVLIDVGGCAIPEVVTDALHRR